MAKLKLFLDTNVIIDYLNVRQPFYEKARLAMICGRVGEFELWMASSQITDLIYVLSNGGQRKMIPSVLEVIRGLRTFVEVASIGADEVDTVLATKWKDPEDALLFEAAMRVGADAIITRNASDFETDLIKVVDCDGLFDWLHSEFGLDYEEVAF